MTCDVVWWCVVCVIVVLCAGGSGVGSGQPGAKATEEEVESSREGEAAAA